MRGDRHIAEQTKTDAKPLAGAMNREEQAQWPADDPLATDLLALHANPRRAWWLPRRPRTHGPPPKVLLLDGKPLLFYTRHIPLVPWSPQSCWGGGAWPRDGAWPNGRSRGGGPERLRCLHQGLRHAARFHNDFYQRKRIPLAPHYQGPVTFEATWQTRRNKHPLLIAIC